MRAVTYSEYGDPSALTVCEMPEPQADGGQVRIRAEVSAYSLFWPGRYV